MKTSRSDLLTRIQKLCRGINGDKAYVTKCSERLYEEFSIPYDLSNDILTMRISGEEESDFILYAILKVMKPEQVARFFTQSEIDRYAETQYKEKKIHFPIRWKMIQVQEDSWIGTIQSKELMKLRSARLINYNENTQRPLTKKTANGTEYYHITINESAVRAIMDSYKNGLYIPNTITLNIPESADFYYNGEELIIRDLESFDIIDGYHRYVALQRLSILDKKFDYTMELRVVSYPEEKARQFIWQEDQKTKMSRIDSESMNQNNIANQVVASLNQKAPFTGLINNNSGKINAAELALVINVNLVDHRKQQNRSTMIQLRDKIYDYLNVLVEDNPSILDNKWKMTLILAVAVLIHEDVPKEIFAREVLNFKEVLERPENEILLRNIRNKAAGRTDVSRYVKLYEDTKGGGNYV